MKEIEQNPEIMNKPRERKSTEKGKGKKGDMKSPPGYSTKIGTSNVLKLSKSI